MMINPHIPHTHTYTHGLMCATPYQSIPLQGIPLQSVTEGSTVSPSHKDRRRSRYNKCFRGLSSSKTRLVLYRGSFFLVASIILIAGGIGSHFKLSLVDGNSTNTTSCGERSVPSTTVLFSASLPDNGDGTMDSLLPPSSPHPSPLSHRYLI